jgi:hypothetical protein
LGAHVPPGMNVPLVQPAGPVIAHVEANGKQQAPIGHTVGVHAPGKKREGAKHWNIGAVVHAAEAPLQHAPGQGFGEQEPVCQLPAHAAELVIVQLLRSSQHAPGQGLVGMHVPPGMKVPVPKQPAGPVTAHVESNNMQHAPDGHAVGVHAPGKKREGPKHCDIGTVVHTAVDGLQHAPGHGLGLQGVFAPCQSPPAMAHAACVMALHALVA